MMRGWASVGGYGRKCDGVWGGWGIEYGVSVHLRGLDPTVVAACNYSNYTVE